MTLEPFVRRVLGDRPFAEIGEPALALVDETSRLVAVGGDVGSVQWSGGATADFGWTGHRVGVYERDGLRCRHLARSRYPVRSLAFHPVLPSWPSERDVTTAATPSRANCCSSTPTPATWCPPCATGGKCSA